MNKPIAMWTFRPAVGKDIPFIYATMLNSLRVDSVIGSSTRKSVFYNEYNPILDNILLNARVTVACLPDDSNVILGYAIHDGNLLHYVYIKEAFRLQGIAKDLYQHIGQPNIITHETKTAMPIIANSVNFIYNPFILYKKGKS